VHELLCCSGSPTGTRGSQQKTIPRAHRNFNSMTEDTALASMKTHGSGSDVDVL